ncbi:immunoglobulin-like domain-containing protein [Paenibacillus sp. YN15]|uniref:immunoglobulin-like domain-containing protein n=1 Tax=Paenibacillus sp. YN15 TaxID=1742774 RepID=UPI000DCE81D9|nr:immunoglobulin-like domain-containing protein [Paenibacillus sp. YN15]RAV04094.1 hypothetical protein DQG13_06340 [Paenibacillus sp. YN15]
MNNMISRKGWKQAKRPFSALTAGMLAVSMALGLAPAFPETAQAEVSPTAQVLTADYGTSAGPLIRTEQFNNTNYAPLPVHVVDELKGIKTKIVRDFVKINWYYNKDPNNSDLLAYSIETPENLETNPDLQHGRKETYDFMGQFADSILISLAYSYGGDTNPGKNRLLSGETTMNWDEYDKAMRVIIKTLKEKNPKLEYIEVGNEPNLEPAYFGHVKDDIPGYMRMYEGMSKAVVWVNQQLGLNDTFGSNGVRLKVGGPVLSGYNFAKQKEFVDIAYQNHYQVDFVSWHRYRQEITENETQAIQMRNYLSDKYPDATLIVSEYGWKGGGGLTDSTNNVALAKQAAFMTDSAYFYERGGVDIPMNWVAVHTLNAYFKNQFDVDYALSNGTVGWQEFNSNYTDPVRYMNLRGWRESATTSGRQVKIQEIEFYDPAGNKIAVPNTAGDPLIAVATDGDESTQFLQSDYWTWLRFDLGAEYQISKIRIKWGDSQVYKFQVVGTSDKLKYHELLGKTFFTPYFNTMRMLSRLGDEKVAVTGSDTGNTGVRLLATKNSDSKATMMVWNHQLDGKASKEVSVQVKNLPASFQGKSIRYKKYLVDATHSNYAYNKNDSLEVVGQGTMNITGTEIFNETLTPNAVMLIELEAVDSSINNIVSAGKTATGDLQNLAALVDGDERTSAAAANNSYPQSVVIDLERNFTVSGAEIKWSNAELQSYHYSISTSTDGGSYSTVVDSTYGAWSKGSSLHWFPATARYVKLTVTGSYTGQPLSIDDISIFADGLYKNSFETPEERDLSAWKLRGYGNKYTAWDFGTDTVTGNTYAVPHETFGDTSDNFGFFGDNSWADYGIEARVKIDNPAHTGDVKMGVTARAGKGRADEHRNLHYSLLLVRGAGTSKLVLQRDNTDMPSGKKNIELDSVVLDSIDPTRWYTLRLEAVGDNLKGYLDGTLMVEYTDNNVYDGNPARLSAGWAGVRGSKTKVQFDDIHVYPIMPLLGDIQVNGASISGFNPLKNEYEVKLAGPGSDKATVTGTVYGGANAVVYPASSGELALGGTGENVVHMISSLSTAGNGATYYKVSLRKASEDATLSSLKLSVIPDSGAYNPNELAPGDILLIPGVYEYDVKIPSRTAYVSVKEALPTVSNLATAVAANTAIVNGQGTITVDVTAESGKIQRYTLHLTANEEAPLGTILYEENFENGSYNQDASTGWRNMDNTQGQHLRVADDVSGKVLEKHTNDNMPFVVGNSSWTNYEVRARVRATADTGLPGIIARASDDARNFYMLRIHNGENNLAGGSTGYIALGRVVNNSLKESAIKKPFPYEEGKWYQLRLIVNGNRLIGYVDDKLVFDVTDTGSGLFPDNPPPLTQGKAGIRVANRPAQIDDYVVALLPGDNTPVPDVVKPVITLNGDGAISIPVGSEYTDAGATATDNVDGDLTAAIAVTGQVNTAVPGVYTLRYNVSDAAGNAANEVIRTVTVFAVIGEGKSFVVTGGLVDQAQGLTARVNVIPVAGAQVHDGDEVVYFQLLKGNTPVSYVALKSDITDLTTFVAHFDVPDPENTAYSIRVLVVDQLFPANGELPAALSDKVVLD